MAGASGGAGIRAAVVDTLPALSDDCGRAETREAAPATTAARMNRMFSSGVEVC